MAYTEALTWGERMELHANRFIDDESNEVGSMRDLYNAIRPYEPAQSDNTWAKLWRFTDPPKRYADVRRAYLLALLIDGDPADYDLTLPVRPALWPADEEMRAQLKAHLPGGSADPKGATSSYGGWVPDQALRAS